MAVTEPKLAEGEAFVSGRSRAKAVELLELASLAGFESGAVKTTSFGYIVPAAILASDVRGLSDADADADAGDGGGDDGGDDTSEADAAADADEKAEETVDVFDPTSATIADVKDYLASADATERERVLAVENASEKPRKGVLDLAEAPEGAK